jgi:nicotinic acid phosphoribosyltransferase
MDYQSKYLKYKSKYENLKKTKLVGGTAVQGQSFYDLFDEAVKNIKNISNDEKQNQELSEFKSWVNTHSSNLQKILNKFYADGKLIGGLSATAHNDLYKLSMMPVFNMLQKTSLNPIVTFGLNLRLDSYANLLVNSDGALLREKLKVNLKSLALRKIKIDIIEKLCKYEALDVKPAAVKFDYLAPYLTHLTDGLELANKVYFLNNINLLDNSAERTAAEAEDDFSRIQNELIRGDLSNLDRLNELLEQIKDEDRKYSFNTNENIIRCYIARDNSYQQETKLKFYIEMTGKWNKVTLLETTTMQCVYETILRYQEEKDQAEKSSNEVYASIVANALFRCFRSVKLANPMPKVGGLFSGRRTCGFVFLVLQVYLMSNEYKPTESDNNGPIRGTSSVDAWCFLQDMIANDELVKVKTDLKKYLLRPIGTHAHELSMVLGAIFRDEDLAAKVPISQVLGHYLFSKSKNFAPIPFLPDTLGTSAFILAAQNVIIKDPNLRNIPFIQKAAALRQDSGELQDFVDIVTKKNKTFPAGGVMASEVGNIHTLREVQSIDAYKSFAAGGFFGDSEKVWDNPDKKNIDMAVKPIRVAIQISENESSSSSSSSGGAPTFKIYYPIKCGDRKDRLDINGTDRIKLSVDTSAPFMDIQQAVEYSNLMWSNYNKENADSESKVGTNFDYRITEIFNSIITRYFSQ